MDMTDVQVLSSVSMHNAIRAWHVLLWMTGGDMEGFGLALPCATYFLLRVYGACYMDLNRH